MIFDKEMVEPPSSLIHLINRTNVELLEEIDVVNKVFTMDENFIFAVVIILVNMCGFGGI